MSLIVEIKTEEGQTIGVLTVEAKNFKTGSRGYHGQAKIDFEGKRYQTQLQMVEIGSKSAAPKDGAAKDGAAENTAAKDDATKEDESNE
ncbi:MAG TPA: hypothetical protein VFD70_28080 [Anaerolineae bacterium]|nr:hypothetical protein [Anaerolineae bacterium]